MDSPFGLQTSPIPTELQRIPDSTEISSESLEKPWKSPVWNTVFTTQAGLIGRFQVLSMATAKIAGIGRENRKLGFRILEFRLSSVISV